MDEDRDALITRRRLLATGAVVAASVALPATSAFAKSSATAAGRVLPLPRYPRTGYRRSRFAPHIGAPVELRAASGIAVLATLASIDDVPYIKGLAGDQDAYTLRFSGPVAQPLAEGIVGIRHKHFGAVELYVTPLPAGGLTRDYLAVVNRRVPRRARRAVRHL